MKSIDFKGQTGLLIVTAVLLLLLSGYGLMIGQLLIGVWQLISSTLSVLFVREFKRAKLFHLGFSAVILLGAFFLKGWDALTNDFILFIVFFLPCWSLAFYYYAITWKWYHATTDRSKFLPNISF